MAELRDSIREALAGDQKNILLNLTEVNQIDSSSLGQLIGSYATVTSRGGQMKLLNLPEESERPYADNQTPDRFRDLHQRGRSTQEFRKEGVGHGRRGFAISVVLGRLICQQLEVAARPNYCRPIERPRQTSSRGVITRPNADV